MIIREQATGSQIVVKCLDDGIWTSAARGRDVNKGHCSPANVTSGTVAAVVSKRKYFNGEGLPVRCLNSSRPTIYLICEKNGSWTNSTGSCDGDFLSSSTKSVGLLSTLSIIGIAIGSGIVFAIVVAIVCYYLVYRRRQSQSDEDYFQKSFPQIDFSPDRDSGQYECVDVKEDGAAYYIAPNMNGLENDRDDQYLQPSRKESLFYSDVRVEDGDLDPDYVEQVKYFEMIG